MVAAHLAALDMLLPSLSDATRYLIEIERLRDLAARSAAALDAPAPPSHITDAKFDPLAVAYVVLGSRLGAKIVTRRLDACGTVWDADVRGYFADEGSTGHWRALCDELDGIDDTCRLEEIAQDARDVFVLYEKQARYFSDPRCMEPN